MQQRFSRHRLREAREAAGVRRETAALAVGRSYEAISAYELGKAVPPTGVLTALAELYGADVADLFEVEVAVR